MDESLRSEIMTKLDSDEEVDELVTRLVDAACESDEAILAVLNGEDRKPRPPAERSGEAPGAYVEEIQVTGFRGVGQKVKLELQPGPGLTVVFGRNGSGKSSFAEALETVLTGTCSRFVGRRSKLWEKGWRNLHHMDKARVEAKLTIEGKQPLHVVRSWRKGAEFDESQLDARFEDKSEASLDDLGFAEALAEFRPFLSHPELGALLEEPSKAYDLLNQVLSLDEVVAAINRLSTHRKELSKQRRELGKTRKEIKSQAEELEDERAAKCAKLLAKREPDLAKLEEIVLGGDDDDDADTRLKRFSRIAKATMPEKSSFTEAKEALQSALKEHADASTGAAEVHASLIEVLEAAQSHFEDHEDEACPVCERPMDEAAVKKVDARLKEAKEATTRFRKAKTALRRARESAEECFEELPSRELKLAFELELIEDPAPLLAEAEERAPDDEALMEKLEAFPKKIAPVVEEMKAKAAEAAEKIESVFRPFARTVAAYLEEAKAFEPRSPHLKPLQGAEKWLEECRAQMRDARFDPIVDRAKDIWSQLSAQSFVRVEDISLAGKRTNRRVEFSAHVDDNEAEALSVMSQGELNALALSIFIPRMCHASSPFKFLVIDDPVQAMDPHKVDGLAKVLDEVAKTRQVIVLTHDGRLVQAIRRLQIQATVHQVIRHPESLVKIRVTHETVEQLLEDARQVLAGQEELGDDVCARVVPTFCRAAIDAACEDAFRRRRLEAGDMHEDVEKALGKARTTNAKAALALFGKPKKAADVHTRLVEGLNESAALAYHGCRKAVHGTYEGDLKDLVSETRRITKFLAKQATA